MPKSPHRLDLLSRGLLRRFGGASDGATAVEFALVALPFMLLIAGIVQCAFMLWASQNLDAALDRAVRGLTTGTFQTANANTTDPATLLARLKAVMCTSSTSQSPTVFSCSDVKLNVSTASSFSGSSFPSAYDSSTHAVSTTFEGYTCPGAGVITVVTAVVPFPNFFSALLPVFSQFGDGSMLLTSTAVFRTEPFTSTTC